MGCRCGRRRAPAARHDELQLRRLRRHPDFTGRSIRGMERGARALDRTGFRQAASPQTGLHPRQEFTGTMVAQRPGNRVQEQPRNAFADRNLYVWQRHAALHRSRRVSRHAAPLVARWFGVGVHSIDRGARRVLLGTVAAVDDLGVEQGKRQGENDLAEHQRPERLVSERG